MGSERKKNPTLFGIGTQHRDESVEVLPPEFSIGRSQDCSLTIQHIAISRLHCTFKYDGTVWSLTDQSSCGTYVNGKRFPRGFIVTLDEGSVVKLGPHPHFIYIFSFRERVDLQPVLSRLALRMQREENECRVVAVMPGSHENIWDRTLIPQNETRRIVTNGTSNIVPENRDGASRLKRVAQNDNRRIVGNYSSSGVPENEDGTLRLKRRHPSEDGMLRGEMGNANNLEQFETQMSSKRPAPLYYPDPNSTNVGQPQERADVYYNPAPGGIYVDHHGLHLLRNMPYECFHGGRAHTVCSRPPNNAIYSTMPNLEGNYSGERNSYASRTGTDPTGLYLQSQMQLNDSHMSPFQHLPYQSFPRRHEQMETNLPHKQDTSFRRDPPATRIVHTRGQDLIYSHKGEPTNEQEVYDSYKACGIEDLSKRHVGGQNPEQTQREKVIPSALQFSQWRTEQSEVEEKENLIDKTKKAEDVKKILDELNRVKSDLSRHEERERTLRAALQDAKEGIKLLETDFENSERKVRQIEKELVQMTAAKNIVDESLQRHEEKLANVNMLVENELQCSICSEIFIGAVTLGCRHTFCASCIGEWKTKKMDCPMCRTPIGEETRSIALDTFIDKVTEFLSDDTKEHRKNVIDQRNAPVEAPIPQQPAAEVLNPVAAANVDGGVIYISSDSDDDDHDTEPQVMLQDESDDPHMVSEYDSDSSGEHLSLEDMIRDMLLPMPTCEICGNVDHTTERCPY